LVEKHGRGLALLGGVRTLGAGQYRATALQNLFGVDLGAIGQWPGEIAFELTDAGRGHPITAPPATHPQTGGPQVDAPPANPVRPAFSILNSQLSIPFAGASRILIGSPTAEVLMRTDPGEPLLVVQELGKARTAVVAFDSTWQWPLAGEGGVETHRRFWRQLVFWLANQQADVWAAAERPRYRQALLRSGAERVTLLAGASGPGVETEMVTLSGVLILPEAAREQAGDARNIGLTWIRKDDRFEAAAPMVDAPGEYRVTVEARLGDRLLGRAETAFIVEVVDLELVEPLADLETLREMASATAGAGGEYAPLSELPALLERVRAAGRVTEVTRVRRARLVQDWAWHWLALFVALIATEWTLRRNWGLI
jgi:hypothetical protein